MRREGERCRDCGGLDGSHGYVHLRHGNGAGSNRPCPQLLVLAALTLNACDLCESCGAAVLCDCPRDVVHR